MTMKNPILMIALIASALCTVHAQVPAIINYQGRVTVGGTNITTNGAQFKFALVNSSGTAVYWKNDGTSTTNEPSSAVTVAVSQGLYSTLLGDNSLSNMAALPSTVFTNPNVNLRVWFSAGGTNPFVRLAPDQRIGASGYALRAAVADTATVTNVAGDFQVTGILTAATIIGGESNSATGTLSFIGGGKGNIAGAEYASVAGGFENFSLGQGGFIGGGSGNTVSTDATNSLVAGGISNAVGPGTVNAVIGGGSFNFVESGSDVTIAGGSFNKARGFGATVAGGAYNDAFGDDTFAAGVQAKATNVGSFVWSGTYLIDTVSTNDFSFTVRAPGGARFLTTTATNEPLVGVILTNGATQWASLSDRNSKTNFQPVEPREILSKVTAMPITSWGYKHDPQRRYIGPMAQDFHAAFGLGSDDKTIGTLDSDGVMYAAIQGLVEELKERDKTIGELKSKLEAVEERLNALPPAP
jgi:hypothetical protein